MSYLLHFAGSPSTLLTFTALLLLAGVVAGLARRRHLLVFLTGASAAAVGGLTLAPADGWTTFAVHADPWAAVARALEPHSGDLWAWSVADGPANVALYVPLGLTLALLLRSPLLAVVVGATTSLTIEAYQAATGTRVGAMADVVANTVGTAIGAILAAVVIMLVAVVQRQSPSAQSPNGQLRQGVSGRVDHAGQAVS